MPKLVAAISCWFTGVELACDDSVNSQWFAAMVKVKRAAAKPNGR
ncbi:hypothetical protein [Glaciecola sp. XM2]|nr:hypothetical protein [Glaciecola sp. XM2]